MKIALINDTHAGVKNGSDIFLKHTAKFYDNVFFPYLEKNNIQKIIHLGDYFEHRKYVNFKVLRHNYEHFIKKLYDYDIHMDIILGNHDVYYKNTNTLNSLREILKQYSDRIHIHEEPTVKCYEGLDIGLLPWMCEENYDKSMDFIKNSKASIMMGHLELSGFKYMGNATIKSHGMDKSIFDRYDAVYSGHYHTKSSRSNVTYLGTQFELTWSDAGDPKYFHVLDTETRKLSAIKNPHVLFRKFYYNEDDEIDVTKDMVEDNYVKVIVSNKKDLYKFDKFIEKIYDFKPYEVKIIENFDEYAGEKINDDDVKVDDTSTLLNSYIDATETNLDQDILKKMLQELLTEAQALDAI